MTNNIRDTIENHKKIIVITAVVAVLVSYVIPIPFDNIYKTATAQDTGPEPGEPPGPEPGEQPPRPDDDRRPPTAERYEFRGEFRGGTR